MNISEEKYEPQPVQAQSEPQCPRASFDAIMYFLLKQAADIGVFLECQVVDWRAAFFWLVLIIVIALLSVAQK